MTNMARKKILAASALLVGLLYIAPPLIITQHLRLAGQPLVLNYNIHRDELFYMSRAREIYDGRWPPSDPHFNEQTPTVLNPLPSLIMASFLAVFRGNATSAYLAAVFVFSAILFLLFYWLGKIIFKSFSWAILFAYVGILTPIALRILNFDGA